MRSRRWLILTAVISVIVFSGCGGDGIGYRTLPGDYFPLDQDREWRYDMHITTYFGNRSVSTSTTATRTVTERLTTTTAGGTVVTATCTNAFPAVPVPDFGQSLSGPIARYADYLFSSQGGLQAWNELFSLRDSDGDGIPNRITLTAAGPPAGAPLTVPQLQPFLPVPTYTGLSSYNSEPLTAIPFYSNNTTLRDRTTLLNIQYRVPDNVLRDGSATEYTSLIETLQATIHFDGHHGACTGKAITDIARNFGPVQKNIDLEFRLADQWLRLWIMMQYR